MTNFNISKKYLWAYALLLLLVVIGGPLLVIWSMNTLFTTGIEYTVENWFATVMLGIVINGGANISQK